MPSDLQVSNIKDLTGSNTGLSIASDGQITVNQNNPTLTLGSNATGFTGIKNLDTWYVNAALTGTQSGIPANKFTRGSAGVGMANIGTGMTLATSGADEAVFTFPVTGIWKVESHILTAISGSDRICENNIKVSIAGTGGTFDTRGQGYSHITQSQSSHTYQSNYGYCYLDVTTSGNNASSGYAVKFNVYLNNSSTGIGYNANSLTSAVTFTRIGDT